MKKLLRFVSPLYALFAFMMVIMPFEVHAESKQTLNVYTYDSYISNWGPGPAIKKAFESQCRCRVNMVGTDDAGSLLSRLQLEGSSSDADVVLGLDNNQRGQALKTGLMAKLPVGMPSPKLPLEWHDTTFMPVDWGWFSFVYNKAQLKNPPDSFDQLLNGHYRIVIEDPRTSTPGLGLLVWLRQVYGEHAADAWRKLRPQIVTVTGSWSEAYGLFLRGEANLVLSYTTSPVYHQMEEHNDHYAATLFNEGNYMEVEVAAKLAHAPHPQLADQFLKFMASAQVQKLMATGNWMYPAYASGYPLPAPFAAAPKPARTLMMAPDKIDANRRAWISEWQNAMSQ
ncbi:Thiamine-binding periplasmic protein [Halomonadaceae bacterium LMG 33818]|uniref:thiamine ABC transporter substrate binding subunit n=1 Tax=Cernens ardua TaxID=3402176 RepID=UPI003EDBDDB7